MRARSLRHTAATLALAVPLALVASLVLTVGAPTAAVAAVAPPTPIAGLPSQIVGGTKAATTADAQAVRMAQVYKFLASPATMDALRAQRAGTATPAQTQQIAQASASSPKTIGGYGGLTKGLGGATSAFSNYSLGTFIGSTIAGEITTKLWGVDANSLVCGVGGGGGAAQTITSFFAGQDCTAFNAAKEQPINTDVSGDMTSGSACFADGACFQIVGTASWMPSTRTSAWNRLADGTYPQDITPRPALCLKQVSGPAGKLSLLNYHLADGSFSQANYGAYRTTLAPSGENGCGGTDLGHNRSIPRSAPAGFTLDQVVGISVPQGPVIPVGKGSANPNRYISCDVTWQGGYRSEPGPMFTEADTDWTGSIPSCPTTPAEFIPLRTTLTLHTVGGADQVLSDMATPQETVDAFSGQYKHCLTTVCTTELEKNGVSCFDGADCQNWKEQVDQGSSTYTCRYGGVAVALSECNVYAPTWQPEAQRTGLVYADPITGKPAPNSPDPKEQGASPVQGTDRGTFGTPVQDPAGPRQCFPTGWGVFNPLEWVQRPVMCALEWAFVPTPAALTANTAKVDRAVATSGLGTITANVTQLGAIPIPGNGCGGIPLKFTLGGPQGVKVDTSLLNACPGTTLAPIAAVAHTILVGLITTLSFLSILRYVATIFGFSGLGGIQSAWSMSEQRAERAAAKAAQ